MNIIERANAALKGEQKAAELDALLVELREQIRINGARLQAITAKDKSTFGSNPGPERQRMITAGDIEALRKLDEEERDLVARLEVLRSLQKRIRENFDAARANEFIEAAPARYVELAEFLKTEAKAQAALLAARTATENALRDLSAQRQHVGRVQNVEFPAADGALLRQLMQVRGYTYLRGPDRVGWFSPSGGPQQLRIIAGALGVNIPRPDRESAAA